MVFRKILVNFVFVLWALSETALAEESDGARQIVDQFQTNLIDVMKMANN